jgi:superfamily II DNA/RNA helicase
MREKEFLPLVAERLKITQLNDMQQRMMSQASENRDIILLSPTGSGKTLAFTLPMLKILKPSTGRVQAVIIVPSRELVIQIASVIREIANGYKVTELYGGHKVEDEINSLKIVPDIVVATPGRLLDHINRRNVDLLPCRILILDEFDKSLELGFEEEMKKITARLKNVSRTMLTSATDLFAIPDFLKLKTPIKLDFLDTNAHLRTRLRIHKVISDSKDKLESLQALLSSLIPEHPDRTIVFVNYRESAERTAEYLKHKGVKCALYHGALDQQEREKAIAMFNNGSRPVLIATDLAARGLDIEQVKYIIHYHQPLTPEAYTHRNGRTARIDREGDVFIIVAPEEDLKEFIEIDDTRYLDMASKNVAKPEVETLFISAGKKEKLSRGDVVGFFIKEGGLESDELGKIDVYDHYTLVAVKSSKSGQTLKQIEGKKIKGVKRKISPVI